MMMKNLNYKLLVLSLCFSALSIAQQKRVFGQPAQINPANGHIRCVSTQYEASLREKYPLRASDAAFENWLAPKVQAEKQRLLTSRTNIVVHIPVVVHVIHNGDAVGSNENISNAQVISQITVLNQDFRRMAGTRGFNNNAVGADVEVEFCLAQRKPDGTATNGIDRVNLGQANWSTEASVEGTLKPQTSWDPTQYFNIWVCAFTNNTSAELGGVLGYAQFPSNSGLGGLDTNGGAANTDGVIIDYRCFGSSDYATGPYFADYDKGRTATHEIGHCFGLRHIWGDNSSCSVNATDSNKDYCPDTPAASEEHYDCATTYNTCTSAAGNDMTQNYMDYSNDTCMNIFTLDQKARILAVIANSPRRSTLATSLACQPPLATESFDKFEGLNLSPNPANAFVTVNVSDIANRPDTITLYNAVGQMIISRKVQSDADLTLSTSSLAKGIYFIKVTLADAQKTLEFIKN